MNEPVLLDDQFWSQRYIHHSTGWDIGGISPPLKAYIDQLEDRNIHILIPGCGNAYEARYLWENGFRNITLIDIAEWLVKKLNDEMADTEIKISHGDFFEHNGQYDLILEQTFFCAIHPSQRQKYAAKMNSLLKAGGKIAGVLFNCHFDGGPPFGGTIEEYQHLFQPVSDTDIIAPCYNSIPPRAGREVFIKLAAK